MIRKLLSALWSMRHLSVEESIQKINASSELKFILTVAGFWLLMRWIIGILIAVHVLYYVSRIFQMVLG